MRRSRGELVETLNARPMPPVPTLDKFAAWDVPEEIVAALEDAMWAFVESEGTRDDEGGDEETVVLAFLYVLTHSEASRAIDRQVRQQNLKVFKRTNPEKAVMEAVASAVDDWQNWRDKGRR